VTSGQVPATDPRSVRRTYGDVVRTLATPDSRPNRSVWGLCSPLANRVDCSGELCCSGDPSGCRLCVPATPAAEWPINQPITERFQSTVEYGWAVSWPAPRDSELGYRELGLFRRRDSIPEPARLTLGQLVNRASREVIHEGSRDIGDGGVIAFTDEAAFTALVEGQRLVFRLTGPTALQRYTARRPDTAVFEISRFSETEKQCRLVCGT
jgi:hypothetical protein